jgi:hypothetical protein
MSIEYESASARRAGRRVPVWLAVAVMGGLLAGGAGVIWKYRYAPARGPNAVRVVTPWPTNPRVGGGEGAGTNPEGRLAVLAAAGEAELGDGVHESAEGGSLLVKAGDAYMRVARATKAGEGPRYAFGTFSLPELEWEHGYLTQGVRRILEQEEFAKQMGVTKEQWERLDRLPAPPAGKWPEAERARLVAMFVKWETATDQAKAAAELVAALGKYAGERRAADQAVMTERVKGIREILTAGQVEKINPIKRWEGGKREGGVKGKGSE